MKLVYLLCTLFVFVSCSKHVKLNPPKNTAKFKEGTRQIHLDFHTSEALDSIGVHFDKKQFQKALIAGNVNTINIFAKGHHSWCYYPTKIGKMHPNLTFDLMGEQIKACNEIGVSVRLYFTVGWSANDVIEHPEWAILRKDGSNDYRDRKKNSSPNDMIYGWEDMAPEGAYAELIYAQTEEILQNYEVDGIWYDILKIEKVNYNDFVKQDLKKHGIDINDETAVIKRQNERFHEFFKKSHDLVKKYNPEASVFYNGTTAAYVDNNLKQFKYEFYKYNTKQDLEDLPTAWGGYDIFPYRSKYFSNTGKDIVAMSGKFHKAWGEFGGFKDKEAILYEAASMVAFGANCNFGDQLHPSGIMDLETYKNIGYAYDYVEQIEDYGVGAKHIARTGLYVGEDLAALEGMTRILCERQINFNVVNTLKDWSDIEVLILPTGEVLDKDVERTKEYAKNGGKIISLNSSAFKNGEPLFDIGANYIGKANYDIDYTVVGEQLYNNLIHSPFLNYNAGIRVKPNENTQILASIREPYFSRTFEHYCSHNNTPYQLNNAAHPSVIRNNNIIYIAHDLDRQYHVEGARLHRDLFINALNLLQTNAMLKVEMPSMGRINLLHQPEDNRYVAHLLYASPIQRGSVRVIEDLVSLYNIPIKLNVNEDIKQAYLVPSGLKLKLSRNNGQYSVVVPELYCHTAIVFEY